MKAYSPKPADEMKIKTGQRSADFVHGPPLASDPRSMATIPVVFTNSITNCFVSASSPDVKMTVRGFVGEANAIPLALLAR